MKANPVGWFEIYVQDMQRARAFYETVFEIALQNMSPPPGPDGAPCEGSMEMCAFPMSQEGYGASGALMRIEGLPSGGGTMVYFSCADCAKELARAVENGGRMFRPKTPIGEHGFIAIVNDTEGNMIGLHSMQ